MPFGLHRERSSGTQRSRLNDYRMSILLSNFLSWPASPVGGCVDGFRG